MNDQAASRRQFLKSSAATAGAFLLDAKFAAAKAALQGQAHQAGASPHESAADYTLHIANTPIEIAPKRIVSAVTYNGQFPGPLLRFKEGHEYTIDIFNDTNTPEQLHWHGQKVPTDVDGAAEEGTPYIPAHGKRRITFSPNPTGLRFYHTHNRAGGNLAAGQYSGQVGPVFIDPRNNPGRYDQEIFLVLKEFEPTLSQGGDMAQDFLHGEADEKLKQAGESAMQASLAKGVPHGYEVGYNSFTINGRMLGHGDPIKVKPGQRVLFHIINGSATEIRSLALPGHEFEVIALDGNPVATPTKVPVLWLGTAERISAVVEMNQPGVWILGDLDDDDRGHGMGTVVEYYGAQGKPQWQSPPPFKWNYARFGRLPDAITYPDETLEMRFAKDNAAEAGFNRWTINGESYPMSNQPTAARFHLHQGRRYRLKLSNASDDIHPIHLHRHTFEVVRIGGQPTGGIFKDVVMLGGYQKAEIEFVADNPGATLFHCHQQLHMDYGFMALFDYV